MTKNIDFNQLENSINSLNTVFEENTAKAINRNITARNWLIGFYIVNYEQNGKDRAKYGEKTIHCLADRLNKKSLSYRNLMLYKQFYLEFRMLEQPIFDYVLLEFRSDENLLLPAIKQDLIEGKTVKANCAVTDCTIGQTPSAQFKNTDLQLPPEKLFSHLSFTHLSLIMGLASPIARVFYELETIKGTWSVRELKRQIHTNYFERSAISRNPEKMSSYILSGSEKMDLRELVKAPFVYEFLGMKDTEIIEESDLEQALINHLEEFINNQEEDLRALEKDGLLHYDVPLSEIWDDALKIIPDDEIAREIITNAVNRLKIRVIDWDKDRCEKCQLCITDCPTKCISFDEENDTIVRNKDRCLRCSICYQTCPFSVIKYFIAKFSMDGSETIHATVKASNLNEDIFME